MDWTLILAAGVASGTVLLFAAVGCNLAWGLVDAVMYLLNVLTLRGRDLLTVRAVRAAATTAEAHRIITGALPPVAATAYD